jgi:hypothetical protein
MEGKFEVLLEVNRQYERLRAQGTLMNVRVLHPHEVISNDVRDVIPNDDSEVIPTMTVKLIPTMTMRLLAMTTMNLVLILLHILIPAWARCLSTR